MATSDRGHPGSGGQRVQAGACSRRGAIVSRAAPYPAIRRYGTNVTRSQPWNMKCMGPNSPRTQALVSVPVNSDS